MRLLGGIAAGLFGLILLAALAAWLVPPMLDWSQYRAQIATLASRQVGRDVRIDGPVTLSLLPQPTLTASGVHIDEAGDGIRLAVSDLRLEVALGPLLGGRIQARDLVLHGLDVRVPWPFEAASYGLRAPTWLSSVSARVRDGRVTIGSLTVTDIDATLSTEPFTRTYRAAGRAQLSGRGWLFTTRLSQPGADGSAGLDLTLDGQGPVNGVGLALSGQISADGSLGGQFSARGPDLAQLLPAPHVPFRTDGRLTAAGGLIAADDLSVDIGGSPGRGAVALRLTPQPRLDVALTTSRLNLDAWLPTLTGAVTPLIPLGIDLSAEAADLAGGVMRRLRGAFDFGAGGVEVRELQAILPGEADLSLAGRVTRNGPAFTGDAHIAAPTLRVTLGWLQSAGLGSWIGSLPDGVLRSADLSGHVQLGGGEAAFSGLDGRIDDMQVTGTAAARLGARLAVSAGLHIARLDLDPWLPPALPTPQALSAHLRPVDVDLRIDAAQAAVQGVDLAPLSFDAAAQDGRLTLRRLEFADGDVKVSASGIMLDGGRIQNARLTLAAPDAGQALPLLPAAIAAAAAHTPALLRWPVKLDLGMDGAPDALGLRLRLDLGDLHVEAQPTADLVSGRWGGPLAIRHPGAPRLAEALGLTGAPAWLGDGSFAVLAMLAGTSTQIAAQDLDLTAGALHTTGQLTLDRSGPRPVVRGRVDADTLPLPLPYYRSPEPLAVAALTGWECDLDLHAGHIVIGGSPLFDRAGAHVSLHGGTLTVDHLAASLSDGTISGRLAFDAAATPPALALETQVQGVTITGPLFDASVDIAAGRVSGAASLRAAGYSAGALLSTLSGDARVTIDAGVLQGITIPHLEPGADTSDAAVTAGFDSGRTPFVSLTADAILTNGAINLSAGSLRAASGEAGLSGSVYLPGDTVDLRLIDRPAIPDPPQIGLRLTGALDAVNRTPELAGLAQWRLAHASAASLPSPSPGP